MKRVIPIIVIICLIAGLTGYFIHHAPTKKKYNELKDHLPTPILQIQNIGPDEQAFINNVMESWEKYEEQCPSEILTEVSNITGYDNSVAGLVRFSNHETPDYSYFNNEQNKREIIVSTVLGTIIPITIDERIYHKNGFAYLRINDHAVEIYEDTKTGVRKCLYFKQQKL